MTPSLFQVRATRLFTRAARPENSELRRGAVAILSGYFGKTLLLSAWDVEAAIPILREYAEDWVEEPQKKGWYVEALVELKVDGHERYIREIEAYVKDANHHDVLRLKFAKLLLRWGRIDEAAVAELDKAAAERPVHKAVRSTSTWKDGKLTRETEVIEP